MWYYFQSEKEKVRERKRMETAAARVGRPKIGGPFLLTDQDGKPFSDKDLLGKWSMVYVSRLRYHDSGSPFPPLRRRPLWCNQFGFTNCPDICPEELDKMTVVVEGVCTCCFL